MKNSDEEKLCDILIGEAVVRLLREKGRISQRALLTKLRLMLNAEHDEVRMRATKLAIRDVEAEMVRRDSPGAGEREKGVIITTGKFGNDGSTRH
ncbi:hypothetical protein ACIP6T_12540 [Pantoea sp. NPDC088449]|uniref:hypothetical protein n=1 Tax=unclassified Pantoea TaxID=2630326 RepID=UPI0031F527ED